MADIRLNTGLKDDNMACFDNMEHILKYNIEYNKKNRKGGRSPLQFYKMLQNTLKSSSKDY